MMADLFSTPTTDPPAKTRRPYQDAAIKSWLAAYAEGQPGALIRAATGMGKTFMAAESIREWLAMGDDRRAKVVVHDLQLVDQWRESLHADLGRFIDLEQGTNHANARCSVTVASRDSLTTRTTWTPRAAGNCKHDWDYADETHRTCSTCGAGQEGTIRQRLKKYSHRYKWLLIFDEAHKYGAHLVTGEIFRHFEKPGNFRIGLTATPERSDGVSLEELCPHVALDVPMFGPGSASAEGWAVPYRQKMIQIEGLDFKNIDVVAGDWDADQLAELMKEQAQLNRLCQPMLDLVGDRQNAIYTPSIDSGRMIEAWLNAKHNRTVSKFICGEDDKAYRRRVLADFEASRFQHLVICSLCREGWDCPPCSAITCLRPTRQRGLAEQIKGRGCRPLPGIVDGLETAEERRAAIAASAKPDCLVIDLVGLTGLDVVGSCVDVFADGKPADIVKRAKELILDGEEDAGKAIEDAENEARLEAERRKQREIAERRRQEQAERARLEADVRYRAHDVDAGHGVSVATTRWAGKQRMKFGKHAGRRLADIDNGYLQWVADKMGDSRIGKAAAAELAARKAARRQPVSFDSKPATVDDINRLFDEVSG